LEREVSTGSSRLVVEVVACVLPVAGIEMAATTRTIARRRGERRMNVMEDASGVGAARS
jgi:hypothetical protein